MQSFLIADFIRFIFVNVPLFSLLLHPRNADGEDQEDAVLNLPPNCSRLLGVE